jgi:DNA-binding GntR family transcriptional regulator
MDLSIEAVLAVGRRPGSGLIRRGSHAVARVKRRVTKRRDGQDRAASVATQTLWGEATEVSLGEREYQTKRDWVAGLIRVAISEGDFQPGQRLTVDDLAAQLNVSPTPIREALSQLEAQGVVEREPHRGTRVALLTVERIKEIYRVRALLEAISVELVCRAHADKSGMFRRLAELCQSMRQAGETCDYEAMTALNFDFHMAIHESSGGSWLLAEIIENVWTRFPFPHDTFAVVPGQVERSLEQHAKIFEAMKDGRGARAGKLMKRHIEDGTKALILCLQKRGDI